MMPYMFKKERTNTCRKRIEVQKRKQHKKNRKTKHNYATTWCYTAVSKHRAYTAYWLCCACFFSLIFNGIFMTLFKCYVCVYVFVGFGFWSFLCCLFVFNFMTHSI